MYTPGRVADSEVQTELEAVSRETQQPTVLGLVLQELNAAPDRVIEGLTVLADGTNWDPGSGQGVYTYYNATWNKLG